MGFDARVVPIIHSLYWKTHQGWAWERFKFKIPVCLENAILGSFIAQ